MGEIDFHSAPFIKRGMTMLRTTPMPAATSAKARRTRPKPLTGSGSLHVLDFGFIAFFPRELRWVWSALVFLLALAVPREILAGEVAAQAVADGGFSGIARKILNVIF